MKILKNGKLSKTSFGEAEHLSYNNTYDIGINSKGIMRLCVFTGSYKKPKFSHYEYYLVKVINENYTLNTDYATYKSVKHRFTIEVLQVIQGAEKKVGDKFTKRGKNLYGNYHELEGADITILNKKHDIKQALLEYC